MESRRKLLTPGLAVTIGAFIVVGGTVVALTRASGPINPYSCPAGVKGSLHPTLVAGDSDEARNDTCVSSLQWALQRQGFSVSVSSHFDDSTTTAVKNLQAKNGLPQSGQVNDKTWVVLESTK